jgi:hypothetical protein
MNMIDYGNMGIFDWHSAWREVFYACKSHTDLLAATGATLIYDQQEAK